MVAAPGNRSNLWTKVLGLQLLEIVLICVMPIVVVAPTINPTAGCADGAILGLLYQVCLPIGGPQLLGVYLGPLFGAVFLGFSCICFLLNVGVKRKASFSRGAQLRLKVALYLSPLIWIQQTITTTAMMGFTFDVSSVPPNDVDPLYLCLAGLLLFVPWVFRKRATKNLMRAMRAGDLAGPIDEAWARPIRKTILELGSKFGRLQVKEICETCKVREEGKIVAIVQDMITKGQITAQYFESTSTVAFDQQANTAALAKFVSELDTQFTEWGKDGKKV